MAAIVKIINEATKILRPLRNDVDNFVQFGNEVEENLIRLFEKHRNNQNSTERVRNSAIEVESIIYGLILLWIENVSKQRLFVTANFPIMLVASYCNHCR